MKKKIFLLAFGALMMVTSICAQDIIVTTDAQKIEAKILEVSKTEIKYKEKDNLDGPTFIIETKEISSVIYANGKVVLYNQTADTQTTTTPTPPASETINTPQTTTSETALVAGQDYNVEILLLSGLIVKGKLMEIADDYVAYTLHSKYYTVPATQIAKVTDLRNGEITTYNGAPLKKKKSEPKSASVKYLSRNGNTYLYDGRSMKGNTYESFLSSNCTDAFYQYQSGHKVATAGWVFFGVGLGLDIIGSSLLIAGNKSGAYVAIPAGICEVVSIPMLIVGYVRMHRTVDTFNSSCARRTTSYWSINASQNGIGIAYNF